MCTILIHSMYVTGTYFVFLSQIQSIKLMAKTAGHILIVDDNASVLNSLDLFLKYQFEKISTLRNPNQISSFLQKDLPDVIVLDMNFTAGINTGNEGIYWLHTILEADPDGVVVMITAYGDIELAIRAIKEGAVDFIVKPWDNNKLLATLQSAMKLRNSKKQVRHLQLREKQLKEDINRGFSEIIGNSPVMAELAQKHPKGGQDNGQRFAYRRKRNREGTGGKGNSQAIGPEQPGFHQCGPGFPVGNPH